jgi:hypothetical protein
MDAQPHFRSSRRVSSFLNSDPVMSFDSRQNRRKFAFRHFGEVVLLRYDLDLNALILIECEHAIEIIKAALVDPRIEALRYISFRKRRGCPAQGRA